MSSQPHWLSPWFFRGVGQPPTSIMEDLFSHFCLKTSAPLVSSHWGKQPRSAPRSLGSEKAQKAAPSKLKKVLDSWEELRLRRPEEGFWGFFGWVSTGIWWHSLWLWRLWHSHGIYRWSIEILRVFPRKLHLFWGFSMAMLNNQMVSPTNIHGISNF